MLKTTPAAPSHFGFWWPRGHHDFGFKTLKSKIQNLKSKFIIGPLFCALAASIALALIFGRVALLNLTTGVVGGDIDGYENMWNNYWVKTAIFDLHRNPFYTDYLYYPTGISLRYHTLNPFNSLLTLPFNLTLGYIPTTNLLLIFALSLTTFFAFLFIRDIVGNPWAAFAGAALFTYANHNVVNFFIAGQTNMISAQWLPLYFFFLFRALHGPSHFGFWILDFGLNPLKSKIGAPPGLPKSKIQNLKYIALSVITLIIMSLTDWQFVMLAVFTTLLYFAFILLTRRTPQQKAILFGRLTAIGGSYAAIVALPLLLPMIKEGLENPWLNISYQSGTHSIDLLDLLGPGLGNPGYLALGAALLGLISTRRRAGIARETALFWSITALLFYLMALGPLLIVGGATTDIQMPYSILQNLPIFNIGRDPGRFNIIATLGVGILAAFGLSHFRLWWPRGRPDFGFNKFKSKIQNLKSKIVIVALFLIFTLAPFFIEAGKARVDPPEWTPFYQQIATDPDSYAILELPPFTEKGRGENHYQMYQVLHNKPRFGGRWARDHKLTNPNNFVKRAALFRHFWLLDYPNDLDFYYPDRDFLSRTDYSTQGLAILNYYEVRYIIVYEQALDALWNEAEFTRITNELFGPTNATPVYQDQIMRAYRVPDALPPNQPLSLDVGDGWFPAGVSDVGHIYRWADSVDGAPSELYTINLTQEPIPAFLQFTAYTHSQPRTLNLAINGHHAASLPLQPEQGQQPFVVEITIPPGNNTLAFTSTEPPLPVDDPSDSRLLSFGMYDVELKPK